ncbi:MAG: methyl-accepting chemotaxis protein [Candidatus Nitrosocaldus sp.]|nr:methyl-accepting chemotaxis protein [Candidatus Nitrosocaldus sp.]MCS7142061.1 methyl-accepting chemotaxis protein [Candidatus Nitrosocaldus sp.]MDW8000914.1 methyl-accepting chemotaxis protein [Candidatus Nitrosocaldus sp.]
MQVHDAASTIQGKANGRKGKEATLEEIADLAYRLTDNTVKAIDEIEKINEEIHLLAVNALIEAARAGEAGKTFSVVASYMSELNKKVESITRRIKGEMNMQELSSAIMEQSVIVKGNRLADIALTNIDIVDRSLYERASDVTWWAHDSYAIEALKSRSRDSIRNLEKRLAIILDAYTVYHDIVVCDVDGNVVASGRNAMLKGRNCKDAEWFRTAFRNRFGFESVHHSPLADNRLVLIFSSVIKDDNGSSGNTIGVLANIFKWKEFAQRIVENIPLPEREKRHTRACITNSEGVVLADSAGRIFDVMEFNGRNELFSTARDFMVGEVKGRKCIVAHALSQGYENYASGLHSLLIQELF